MDQILNIFLEMYYDQLGKYIRCIVIVHFIKSICSGVQNVFKIWFIYQTFVVFSVLVVSNVYIFFDTKKNNPELWGNVQTNRYGVAMEIQISRKPIFYIYGMEMDNVECDLSVHEM